MSKIFMIALASAASMMSAGAAHAGNVTWSVGISAPPVATVISNAPVYAPAPVYLPPAQVYYEPAPVVVAPAPVYLPPRVVYRPAPVYAVPQVVYRAGYVPWRHHHHHDEYGERYDERRWAPVPEDPRRYHHDR